MSMTKYDYVALKQQYVTSDTNISIRELARVNDIASWSTVAQHARKQKWEAARKQYRAVMESKSLEYAAAHEGELIAKIRKDTLNVIHGAILKMGIDLQDRWVQDPGDPEHSLFIAGTRVRPDEIVRLIDKFLVMSGQVSDRTAQLGLTLNANAGDIPLDLARELAAAARAAGAGAGPVGRSPLPGGAEPKSVN